MCGKLIVLGSEYHVQKTDPAHVYEIEVQFP